MPFAAKDFAVAEGAANVPLYAALAHGLIDHGVDTMFGLLGDANMFMVDRFVHAEQGSYVSAGHEAGAVLMACGYAHRSGRLGVAAVSNGPALTNTVTALVEGVHSHKPVVLIVGDTPAVIGPLSPQAIPQREVALAAGAGFEESAAPYTVLADLARAIRRAHLERRPIVLSIPNDFQEQPIEYRYVPTGLAGSALAPNSAALDAAVSVLAAACHPVVVLGRGVSDDARPAVLRFAERIGAPVATSLGGRGQLQQEPFGIGVFGVTATAVGRDVIGTADCVVAFATRLAPFTTVGGSLLAGKALIHCDIDAASIGGTVRPDVGVVGDAGTAATELVKRLDQADIKATDFRSPGFAERLEQSAQRAAAQANPSPDTPIDIHSALRRLNAAISENRTVVVDGGRFMQQPWRLLDVNSPQAWMYAIGFGAIGMGMGMAIGAGVAAPDDPVAFVCGDGGFMTSGITEFNTAVRHNIDLITIVCNDGAYGAEYQHLRHAGLDPVVSTFAWPELAAVAESLGGRGVTVRTIADLDVAERAIRERDRPLLIDVKLNPEEVPEIGAGA